MMNVEKTFVQVIRTVLDKVLHHKNTEAVIKSIPLSNNTMKRRIHEMSENVEVKLIGIMRTNDFSIQVDKSTLPG